MAKLVIEFDSENKKDTKVSLDGVDISDIEYINLYSPNSKYASMEIRTYQRDEASGITKYTTISASDKNSFQIEKSTEVGVDPEVKGDIQNLINQYKKK